jgi:hypothetical protein
MASLQNIFLEHILEQLLVYFENIKVSSSNFVIKITSLNVFESLKTRPLFRVGICTEFSSIPLLQPLEFFSSTKRPLSYIILSAYICFTQRTCS